jgi:sulfonate transport system substrate-binding protein
MEAAGVLKGTPYRIDWSLFVAASPLLEALGARAIDIGGVGDAPFAFAYASGSDIKAVQAYRYDSAGHASAILVLAGSPIRTVQGLKGHTIATVRGSASHDLVLRVLEHNGLRPTDVKFVFLANGDAKAALARGDVDAWSSWSSYAGIALLHDHDRAIADATGLTQGFGFQAATNTAIATKHRLIDDFLHRLNLAYRWAETHPRARALSLAKETGVPLDVAAFVAQAVYQPVPISARTAVDERQTLERYQRAGVIQKVPDLTNAFDT